MQKIFGKSLIKKAINLSIKTGVPYQDIAITLRDFPKISKEAIEIAKERNLCPWDVAWTLKNYPKEAHQAIDEAEWENQSSWLAINFHKKN